jgi:hypothetical protein
VKEVFDMEGLFLTLGKMTPPFLVDCASLAASLAGAGSLVSFATGASLVVVSLMFSFPIVVVAVVVVLRLSD